MRYIKFSQTIIRCSCINLFFTCFVKAENTFLDWETQLYGGQYYEDNRIAAYGIASKSFLDDFSITGEVLYENYRDYNFSGIGGHLFWDVTNFTRFGLVGSHSHEEFTYDLGIEGQENGDLFNTLGLTAELNLGPVTLAVQRAKIINDDYNNDQYYLSMDIYYWGTEYRWYARGAIRRTQNYDEYSVEGYRTLLSNVLPTTLYIGATRSDLVTIEELQPYRTSYDSVYTGCYIEFLKTSSTRWNLWVEALKLEEETVYSVELNVAFGPGVVDAPYITAFGFSPWQLRNY